jgi:hypothetical protein
MMEREFIPLSRTSSRLSHRKNSAFARIFGRSLGSSVGGIITVLTSLNCGVEVLCFHALEPDLNCYTQGACVASLNRLMANAKHDTCEADGSDTRTGGFVKYAVLITRPSRADPLK